MNDLTYLNNSSFVDALYEQFLDDPASVSPDWRAYFIEVQAAELGQDRAHAPVRARFLDLGQRPRQEGSVLSGHDVIVQKQVSVLQLINAYRFRGHQIAELNPLDLYAKPNIPELTLEFYNLGEADLDITFSTGSLCGNATQSLRVIIERLQTIYCRSIGAEYMHITETHKKRWIQARLEGCITDLDKIDTDTRVGILERLTAAEGLEHYLEANYVGQKRFSLEGSETLIPVLDEAIQRAGQHGIEEVVIGMAHRGRLNVLVNIMGKPTKELFGEFEGENPPLAGSGDVKYHQGYSSHVNTPGGPVHLALAFNPSHLEIIGPVVEGSVRARQDRRGDKQHCQVLPLLIHGDAAFSGQGVIMETLNLSQTHGYKTGGSLHIIINNQIGFTTSEPFDSRSTQYCTDVAKMVQAPIFHVNADDPEAVLFVTRLALDFRMAFNEDVFIDLVCYRRKGHNETDEPAATQPLMYEKIRHHPTLTTLYAESLIKASAIKAQDAELMAHMYKAALKAREVVSRPRLEVKSDYIRDWKKYLGHKWTEATDTAIHTDTLQRLGTRLLSYPREFVLHRSVERVMQARQQMLRGEIGVDWGLGEALAFASLLDDGYPVRLSGQDSGRGTFAHRHAVLHDQNSGDMFIPLQYLKANQPQFLVINSLLSEEAVLAFEYGYSSAEPETLVIWEAQFGDFANGAQVVIDQFLSSSEAKWQRLCGLVILLPHGYDGQGPEHSSARLERYLQLCAENNLQVCIPSTPAQYFHMLRRQMCRPYRKPLIVLTSKSLLRDKRSASPISAFSQSQFATVLDDDNAKPQQIKRVLLCSGQVYYKLLAAREERGADDIAIVRLEQLYPFPRADLSPVFERYAAAREWFWVQEEPRNQGAWQFVNARITDVELHYAGRLASASPAAGYLPIHRAQEKELIDEAFDMEFA
jgi:2-oxoglutarate dehydrogenase E1 component